MPVAAQLAHRPAKTEQSFHGSRAKCDYHFRLHGFDLLDEEGQAVLHLLRRWWSISRRASWHVGSRLEDVRDVNLVATEAHRLDDLRQQLTRATNERLALSIFIRARRF